MFFESFLLNFLVAVVLIFALIFDYVTKFFSYWYIRHIPYKTPIPFFGSNYHRVFGLRSTADEVRKLYNQYPKDKFVGCINSRIPELIVKDPISIQKVLSIDFSNFHYRGYGLDKSRDVCLRNNLFYTEEGKWTLLREKLELILNHMSDDIDDSLRDCLSGTNGYTKVQQLLSEILDVVFKDLLLDNNSDKSYIKNLRDKMEKRTLAGKLLSYLKETFPSIYVILGFNGSLTQELEMHDNILRKSKINKHIQNSETIYERKEVRNENTNLPSNLLIFSILNSFISEGYIPCSNLLTALLFEVARCPDIQKKVRKCKKDECNDYLSCVINESLRLHPSYPTISRKCTKIYHFSEPELQIDKGITITIPVEEVHKDEKHFKDATVFNPDRFVNSKDSEYSAFLPFGMGSRKCIGERLAMRIVRAVAWKILNEFEVEPTEKTPKILPVTDYNFKRVVSDDIWLNFRPIPKCNNK